MVWQSYAWQKRNQPSRTDERWCKPSSVLEWTIEESFETISEKKETLLKEFQNIETAVKRCFKWQVATETKHTEPAKMTEPPSRPWAILQDDLCGPFLNEEYTLVVKDQYSRYSEVEFVTCTTSFGAITRWKLKQIFSTYGVPEIFPTDNKPPFNSHMFAVFAQESGFKHKQVTHVHSKAQGQVEGFNNMVKKLLPSQDKKTRPCRTPRDNPWVVKSSRLPVKTATYLVSISPLLRLAFFK